jgi:beta-glucosidase/6-phospho-beta-glucosidase/beta-galactosidase
MKSLCIIACGKKKIWDKNPAAGPVKAENLYTGSFTRKCMQYAKKADFSSWCILSAKYGFLFPDEIVHGQYNECFHNKTSNPITLENLFLQIKSKELDKYEKITILSGNYYTHMMKKLFSEKEVINPLNGCKGIGHMMKKLNGLIDTAPL